MCTVEICGKKVCSNEGISLKTRSVPSANELNTLKAEEPDVVEGIGCPTPKICSTIPGFSKRILPPEEKERITPELDHANRTRTVYHPPAIPT